MRVSETIPVYLKESQPFRLRREERFNQTMVSTGATMRVFLSVGRVATQRQQDFIEKVEAKLRAAELEPRTIGRNTFTSGQPLERVKQLMKECSGILVVAFERMKIEKGTELGELGKQSLDAAGRRYPTPWHQVELGMSTMCGLPTLVLLEKGLHEDGLLGDKYGWFVVRTELDPESLNKDEVDGILKDWIDRCKAQQKLIAEKKQHELKPGELTVGQLLAAMKPAQLWSVAAAVLTVILGSFGLGRWLPGGISASEAQDVPESGSRASVPLPTELLASATTCNAQRDQAVRHLHGFCPDGTTLRVTGSSGGDLVGLPPVRCVGECLDREGRALGRWAAWNPDTQALVLEGIRDSQGHDTGWQNAYGLDGRVLQSNCYAADSTLPVATLRDGVARTAGANCP